MKIEQLKEYSAEFLSAVERLLPQLTTFSPVPKKKEVMDIFENPGTTIWVLKDDHQIIVGMLTLVIYKTPTGTHAWIEDVVIDEKFRGRGNGKILTLAAIDFAKKNRAKAISLTSRSFREAANHMYQNLGFQLQDTNLYRLDLE